MDPSVRYRRAVQAAAAGTALIGTIALVGWAFDIQVFQSVVPGLVTMKFNTALCFVLAGLALWSFVQRGMPGRLAVSVLCAAIIALAGAVTLAEYALGWDAGIDQLLWNDDPTPIGTSSAGRMAVMTAAGFLCIGISLNLLGSVKPRIVRVGQMFAALTALLGFASVTGHILAAETLYAPFRTSMAPHTAAGLLLVALGMLLARADVGFPAVATADAAGGHVVRRMLVPVVGIPLAVGWIRLWGQRAGLYETEMGVVLTILVSAGLLVVVLFFLGHALNRADREHRQAVRKLAETRDQLQAIVDATNAAIYMKDLDGRFVFANRGLERLLSLPAEQIVGKTVYDFFPAEAADEYAATDRRVLEGGIPVEEEVVASLQDGPHTFLSLKVPLRDASGKTYALCGVSSDITHRKHAEEEMQQARAEAVAANQELEAFCYAVAHDLRAPLRGLDGFSAALMEDYGDRLDVEGVEHLRRIRTGAQRMAQTIDDLLTLSRVTRLEMERTTVDLAGLAQGIADRLRRAQPGRRVEFVIQEGLVADGDTRLLELALENLLGNAWKYTSKRPQARIEFGLVEGEATPTWFVRDDGAGFDMAYSAKLFRPFQRLHASHEFEGTGIGLANVQRIAGRHGGRVWAVGQVDRGATFYFTLGAQGGKRDRQGDSADRGQPGRRGAYTPRPQEEQHL